METEEYWVNTKAISQHLGISPGQISRLARNNLIPTRVYHGNSGKGYWMFKISEIDKWAQSPSTWQPDKKPLEQEVISVQDPGIGIDNSLESDFANP